MNLDKLFVKDPNTGLPSVSLTILMLSFFAVLGAGVAEMFEAVKSTSVLNEIFFSASALYFGRKMSVKGQDYSSEKAQEIETKINEAKKENE